MIKTSRGRDGMKMYLFDEIVAVNIATRHVENIRTIKRKRVTWRGRW